MVGGEAQRARQGRGPRAVRRGVPHPALAALAVALGLVVLPAVAGVGWPAALGGLPCAGAQTAGALRLGLVVDFGVAAADGAPSAVQPRCVRLANGANGFDVLQAAGYRWRTNSAGLLCALVPPGGDTAYPATGCGERTATGYRYWAYFHGRNGVWSYAADGPYGHRMVDGEVDGWHFVEGTGRPGDPPPNGTADINRICPADPPPTSSPAPAPTVPAATPTSPTAAPSPSTLVTPTVVAAVPGAPTTAPPPLGAPDPGAVPDPGATGGGSEVVPPVGAPGTTVAVDDGAAVAALPVAAPGGAAGGGGAGAASGGAAAGSAAGGPPLGVLVAVVVGAGLGVAATVRLRRSEDAS